MPITNISNLGKQINVENTYSVKSIGVSKNAKQSNYNINNIINNNENDNVDISGLNKLRSNTAETNSIKDITQNIRNKAVTRDFNELKETVKNVEIDQVKVIEETNAEIARNKTTTSAGARLVNNFFTNLSPNIGGKVDTVA